jgi:hypothetical protein
MAAQAACWRTDTRCTSCNAGYHLEFQELYTCSSGNVYWVTYGCGSC